MARTSSCKSILELAAHGAASQGQLFLLYLIEMAILEATRIESGASRTRKRKPPVDVTPDPIE